MTQEALKELLEAVEAAIQAGDWSVDGACDPDSVIKRSKEALAELAMREVQRLGQEIEQEPMAWQWLGSAHFRKKLPKNADVTAWNPLYTAPPQRTWVGLNDDEIDYLIHLAYTGDEEFVQTIEAKLKEKNT